MIEMFNIEAEMSCLGAMLLSERAADDVALMLKPEDFHRPAHSMIFRAMRKLVSKHEPIDTVTLEDELKLRGELTDAGGPNYILELANFTPSSSNSNHYASIVQDRATLRRLHQSANEILGVCQDEDLDIKQKLERAEGLIFEVRKKDAGSQFTPIKDLALRFCALIDGITETGEALTGSMAGFIDLDKVTGGFFPGDLVIIGGRPAMGKTALALDFAVNTAKQRKGAVAIFSLEMSEDQLYQRMAGMVSGVSTKALRDGRVSQEDYSAFADANESLHDLPMFINDSSLMTPPEMRAACLKLAANHGISFVVVDYLQLIRGTKGRENRTQEISEYARALKSMARELGCPVIALAQLNRGVESRDDKRPHLADLRDSGSIEAEADLVLLLYREAYYKAKETHQPTDSDELEEAEVIIAKHRNGPTGIVKLGFQPAYTRYRNIYRGEQ